MDQRDRLFDLLNVLYAAPGTEDGWLVFLDSVCAAIDATGASFISVNPLGRANVAVSARTDPAALSEYAAHWGAVDPWGSSARLRDINPGGVVLGSELIGWSALTRTDTTTASAVAMTSCDRSSVSLNADHRRPPSSL
jgi:hypothetical protein